VTSRTDYGNSEHHQRPSLLVAFAASPNPIPVTNAKVWISERASRPLVGFGVLIDNTIK